MTAATQPADTIGPDDVSRIVRKRHRLAARMVRLLLSSNGNAGRDLALLDDVELPAPFCTYYQAAAILHENGQPVTFDNVSERLRESALLLAVGGYNAIETLKRGDDIAPGPDTLAECVEAYLPLARQIAALDTDVEKLARAGYRITAPDDAPPDSGPAPAEQNDPPVESWPEPPDTAAYHGILGDLVRRIEPHTEADPVAVLMQLLVGLGNMIGGGPHYRVGATAHHLNEYGAAVGCTSVGRKGTAWDQALRPLAAVDETWARERVQGGLSSGEGLIHAVRDARSERRPIMKSGRVEDYQVIETDAGVTDKRLLAYEPELARVLRSMLREGSTLSAIIRQAWDGPHLRVMAKQAAAAATGAHISIVAHITAEELTRQLQETDAASGFGNRFIWIAVKRSKLLPDGGDLDPASLAPLLASLSTAVSFARRVTEMTRDPEARTLWRTEYPRLTAGRPGLLGAMTSRAEAHVLRLSMLYALADSSAAIRRPHLEAALALWDYAARSCAFIFGASLGDPTADELLRALRAAPDGMTRNDLRQHFQRNKSAAEIGRALGVLTRQGLARSSTEKADGPGRPAERWYATTPGGES
jgi:hypothetical protein